MNTRKSKRETDENDHVFSKNAKRFHIAEIDDGSESGEFVP